MHQVKTRPDSPAFRTRVAGAWHSVSWAQWHTAAREVAAGLAARGLGPGARVAVLAREGAASMAVDLGITALGAVTIPLPPGVPAPELGAILRDAEVTCLFADAEFTARLAGACGSLGAMIELTADGSGGRGLETLRAQGRAALADGPAPSQLAAVAERMVPSDAWCILYTSGTTGVPRGIILTHGAAIYQGCALAEAGGLGPDDEQLLVLPTSQIFGRMALQAGVAAGMPTAIGGVRSFDRDVVEIAPVYFSAVPDLLERLAARWRDALDAAGWARPALERALAVGRRVSALRQRGEAIPLGLGMQHRLAERMVLTRLRAQLGTRLRFVACGGAALRRDLVDFFHAFGVSVLEGYGLTEAGGVVAWNRPDDFRFGTLGRILPGCDAKLADDGELLVRSPSLGTPLRTDPDQPSVDEGGYLHTGDIAELQDGFVRLVGRKRDIIKTIGGKLIAPQKLEVRLAACEGIARAVVLGEGRARPVVLVDIDEDAMMDLARREGLGCRSRSDLVEHPRIRAHIAEAIAAVNASLARHEAIADFGLLAEPLLASAGELTATGALRRQSIAARHADQVATLGAGGAGGESPAGPSATASA